MGNSSLQVIVAPIIADLTITFTEQDSDSLAGALGRVEPPAVHIAYPKATGYHTLQGEKSAADVWKIVPQNASECEILTEILFEYVRSKDESKQNNTIPVQDTSPPARKQSMCILNLDVSSDDMSEENAWNTEIAPPSLPQRVGVHGSISESPLHELERRRSRSGLGRRSMRVDTESVSTDDEDVSDQMGISQTFVERLRASQQAAPTSQPSSKKYSQDANNNHKSTDLDAAGLLGSANSEGRRKSKALITATSGEGATSPQTVLRHLLQRPAGTAPNTSKASAVPTQTAHWELRPTDKRLQRLSSKDKDSLPAVAVGEPEAFSHSSLPKPQSSPTEPRSHELRTSKRLAAKTLRRAAKRKNPMARLVPSEAMPTKVSSMRQSESQGGLQRRSGKIHKPSLATLNDQVDQDTNWDLESDEERDTGPSDHDNQSAPRKRKKLSAQKAVSREPGSVAKRATRGKAGRTANTEPRHTRTPKRAKGARSSHETQTLASTRPRREKAFKSIEYIEESDSESPDYEVHDGSGSAMNHQGQQRSGAQSRKSALQRKVQSADAPLSEARSPKKTQERCTPNQPSKRSDVPNDIIEVNTSPVVHESELQHEMSHSRERDVLPDTNAVRSLSLIATTRNAQPPSAAKEHALIKQTTAFAERQQATYLDNEEQALDSYPMDEATRNKTLRQSETSFDSALTQTLQADFVGRKMDGLKADKPFGNLESFVASVNAAERSPLKASKNGTPRNDINQQPTIANTEKATKALATDVLPRPLREVEARLGSRRGSLHSVAPPQVSRSPGPADTKMRLRDSIGREHNAGAFEVPEADTSIMALNDDTGSFSIDSHQQGPEETVEPMAASNINDSPPELSTNETPQRGVAAATEESSRFSTNADSHRSTALNTDQAKEVVTSNITEPVQQGKESLAGVGNYESALSGRDMATGVENFQGSEIALRNFHDQGCSESNPRFGQRDTVVDEQRSSTVTFATNSFLTPRTFRKALQNGKSTKSLDRATRKPALIHFAEDGPSNQGVPNESPIGRKSTAPFQLPDETLKHQLLKMRHSLPTTDIAPVINAHRTSRNALFQHGEDEDGIIAQEEATSAMGEEVAEPHAEEGRNLSQCSKVDENGSPYPSSHEHSKPFGSKLPMATDKQADQEYEHNSLAGQNSMSENTSEEPHNSDDQHFLDDGSSSSSDVSTVARYRASTTTMMQGASEPDNPTRVSQREEASAWKTITYDNRDSIGLNSLLDQSQPQSKKSIGTDAFKHVSKTSPDTHVTFADTNHPAHASTAQASHCVPKVNSVSEDVQVRRSDLRGSLTTRLCEHRDRARASPMSRAKASMPPPATVIPRETRKTSNAVSKLQAMQLSMHTAPEDINQPGTVTSPAGNTCNGPVRIKKSPLPVPCTTGSQRDVPASTPIAFVARLQGSDEIAQNDGHDQHIGEHTNQPPAASRSFSDPDETLVGTVTTRRISVPLRETLRHTRYPSESSDGLGSVERHALSGSKATHNDRGRWEVAVRPAHQSLVDQIMQITNVSTWASSACSRLNHSQEVLFRLGEEEDAIAAKVDQFRRGGESVMGMFSQTWTDRWTHEATKVQHHMRKERDLFRKANNTLNEQTKAKELKMLPQVDELVNAIEQRKKGILAAIQSTAGGMQV